MLLLLILLTTNNIIVCGVTFNHLIVKCLCGAVAPNPALEKPVSADSSFCLLFLCFLSSVLTQCHACQLAVNTPFSKVEYLEAYLYLIRLHWHLRFKGYSESLCYDRSFMGTHDGDAQPYWLFVYCQALAGCTAYLSPIVKVTFHMDFFHSCQWAGRDLQVPWTADHAPQHMHDQSMSDSHSDTIIAWAMQVHRPAKRDVDILLHEVLQLNTKL